MKDPNSPEAVLERASQEDPIIMYLIVRESLGMSIGKTAAQCAHAAQMLLINYFDCEADARNNPTHVYQQLISEDRLRIFEKWLNSSFRKVVLRADDKEFEKIKSELPKNNIAVVVDAGLTELVPGSETVIGVYPMHKSQVPKCIKRLQVLK